MADLFRAKIVSKRQLTIPQRMMDLLGLKQGDEIHFKVMKGKLAGVQPVHIGDGELEPEVAERFQELENETTMEGLGDTVTPYVSTAQPLSTGILPIRHWTLGYEPPGPCFSSGPDWIYQSPALGASAGGFVEQLVKRHRSGPMNVKRDDARLQEAVAEALANSFLDFSHVALHTHHGEVTLTGTMQDYREKLAAELFASSVWGVTSVRNEIEVASSSGAENASSRNKEDLKLHS